MTGKFGSKMIVSPSSGPEVVATRLLILKYTERRKACRAALSHGGIVCADHNTDRRIKMFQMWNYLHQSKTETADCKHVSLSVDATEVSMKKVNVVCVSLPEKKKCYWSPPVDR